MVRVPLPFRGVTVLLLAASTVVGQTPEPPAELSFDPGSSSSADFLQQFSSEKSHPLLALMVDGQLTSLDSATLPDSSRLKPTPQTQSASPAPATESVEACPDEVECPTIPTFLPYACPPRPPPAHKHSLFQRHHKSHCGGSGRDCGNPYLGWPCAMNGYDDCYGSSSDPYQPQGSGGHKWFHKHGCSANNGRAYPGCGYPYGSGCGMMGDGGFLDGGCCGGFSPYLAPPPPPQCHCRKCQRKHGHGQQGGYADYGFPYGGGCGMMGNGGFMDGSFCGGCAPYAPPPPPQCHCRKCQRKRGYGYEGSGYPGWPAYPVPGANMVDDGYNFYTDPNCRGCGKHHRCGLFHHCRHHNPSPYPYYAYPQMMPCMQMEAFCDDCTLEGEACPAPATGGKSN